MILYDPVPSNGDPVNTGGASSSGGPIPAAAAPAEEPPPILLWWTQTMQHLMMMLLLNRTRTRTRPSTLKIILLAGVSWLLGKRSCLILLLGPWVLLFPRMCWRSPEEEGRPC